MLEQRISLQAVKEGATVPDFGARHIILVMLGGAMETGLDCASTKSQEYAI